MKNHFIVIFYLSLFFSLEIHAQQDSLFVKKIIVSESNNLVDSNFINQNYFKVFLKNEILSDSLYHVDFSKGEIIR